MWLYRTVQNIKQCWGVLPSLAFVHIPIQAFGDVQHNSRDNVGGAKFFGLNADVPLDQQGNGAVGRNYYVYDGQDIPFMQTLLYTQGLHSIYSGHDHGDSWCATWQNETQPAKPSLNRGLIYAENGRPFLSFAKHSGFGGYGNWKRGSRQVQLSFDKAGNMQVQTWVRMERRDNYASITTNVTLNSTYDKDGGCVLLLGNNRCLPR